MSPSNPFLLFPMPLSSITNDPSTFIAAIPSQWDGRSYGWKHDAEIRDAHERRRSGIDVSFPRDEAITLLQEHFGSVYKCLTEELRSDEELLMLAAVQSKGHEMRSAPPEVIAQLSPEWWIEAAKRGVRGWVLSMAPAHIRDHDGVVAACVGNCGDAILYASERLRRDHVIQRIAVTENSIAIDRCIDPPEDLVRVAKPERKDEAHSSTFAP